jgi:phosphoglucosamine mutase
MHFSVLTALGAENPTDGIRQEGEDGWTLIRASGTEPKIRITVEGKTAKDAHQLLEASENLVKRTIKQIKGG